MILTRLFIISVALFLLHQEDHAQRIAFGFKGGATTGTPYSKPKEGASGGLGTGLDLGAFLKHEFSRHFSVRMELFYSFKGASFDTPISGDTNYAEVILGTTYLIPTSYSGRAKGTFENNYLNLPLFLSYKAGKRFDLMAGPQISYLIKGRNSGTADVVVGADPNYPYTSVTGKPFDQSDYLNKWDYSFSCGTIFEANPRLNINLNFSRGFNSVFNKNYKSSNGTVRNIYMQLTIDLRIGKITKETDEIKNTPSQ
jgi:hypothetical protein